MDNQDRGEVNRRTLIKGAAVSAFAIAGAGILAACDGGNSSGGNSGGNSGNNASAGDNTSASGVLDPKAAIDYTKATNFDFVPESKTTVGTTKENLITAITGETGATTKYSAYAAAAQSAGYTQIARLFQATADAEKIHIELEFAALQKIDSGAVKPIAPTVETHATDINLIFGANGEIYETSDMYPSFIKAATAAGDTDVAAIFARAKLAESVHAERYLDAYNNIDNPDNDSYYLCPVCGYIHKGENIIACPICLTKKAQFKAY